MVDRPRCIANRGVTTEFQPFPPTILRRQIPFDLERQIYLAVCRFLPEQLFYDWADRLSVPQLMGGSFVPAAKKQELYFQ